MLGLGLGLTTVRRPPGGAAPPSAWTPASLGASLALWLDAEDASTITLNGSTVSQWAPTARNSKAT
jgi:hypothetical protein